MANVYPLDIEQTYRTPAPQPEPGANVIVTMDGKPVPAFDASTGTTQVELPDGIVQVSFGPPQEPKKDSDFGDNLAEHLTEAKLSAISERLLMGIEQDESSRAQWLENAASGISLLGLEAKTPRGAAASGATPAEGTSTVDHPLLLEAVLRFQANALGELLPSDGPVKVRNDGEGNALADKLANALEKDMNHYLTKTAKEYYPDTDRMLLLLGFSGISFKKGYHDPIKRRPVIASIDAKDLIVSNSATNIDGAGRVTHRIMMKPSTLKRMQLLGAYRNIDLPLPSLNPIKNPVDAKIDQVQGIAPATTVEYSDQDRELYECYCEIEVPGFEHEMDGEFTGLPLPFKVVLDKEARRVLEIRRNWEEDDEFCMPRNRIIAYCFIPGLGFYGIGLLNILGNATKAVTAAWRLMLDAGMFANFPGFLYLKQLARQMTNQFRIPPGGGMPIDTVGNDIRASVMPLPYKDPSAVFIQLIENVVTTAQRVGGTAETQVGEGKQDAPVGTTLALIEQATKLMSAVHKRLHQAQSQEFDMLKSLLMEDPEALWRHNKKSEVLKMLIAEAGTPVQQQEDETKAAERRHRDLFLTALADCELVPRADPNTSSQTERYMKIVALRQMAQTNQNLDMDKVDSRAITTMGYDDADSFFKKADPNAPPPQPAPEALAAQATIIAAQARLQDAQTKAEEARIKAANLGVTIQSKQKELDSREKIASLGVAREMIIHKSDQEMAARKLQMEHGHKTSDRQSKVALAHMGHHANFRKAAEDRQHSMVTQGLDQAHEHQQGVLDRQHEAQQSGVDRFHDMIGQNLDQNHEAQQGVMDRQHDMMGQGLAQRHELVQGLLDRAHQKALAAQAVKAKTKGVA